MAGGKGTNIKPNILFLQHWLMVVLKLALNLVQFYIHIDYNCVKKKTARMLCKLQVCTDPGAI